MKPFYAFIRLPRRNLFEEGSVVNVMTSMSGQRVCLQACVRCVWKIFRFPYLVCEGALRPPHGIQGDADKMDKLWRPLLALYQSSQKLGLRPRITVVPFMKFCAGGIDFSKDDENVNSQTLYAWIRDRFEFLQGSHRQAEAETG